MTPWTISLTISVICLGKRANRMGEVKLHGLWNSPFVMRVVWTLKLKGIPYDYIEHGQSNMSSQPVQDNPMHKKVPILVHCGKHIFESKIIMEYIDEVWSQNALLPADPYEKARTRLWVRYVDYYTSMLGSLYGSSADEEREKAKEKMWEYLKVVEEHSLDDQKKFFGGDTMNMLDIAFGSFAKLLEVLEDVLQEKVLEAERFPRLHSWFDNFKGVPVIKESIPDHDRYVAFMKAHREKMLAMPAS